MASYRTATVIVLAAAVALGVAGMLGKSVFTDSGPVEVVGTPVLALTETQSTDASSPTASAMSSPRWPQDGGPTSEVLEPELPPIACFAEDTDPEVVQRFNDWFWSQMPATAYFTTTRWPGGQGNPRIITWSFVPDGLNITSAGSWDNGGSSDPSELFSRMDSLFGGNRALWMSKFEEVFERWSQLTGITYERKTTGGQDWDDGATWGTSGGTTRGDVRIAMRNIDGGSNTLAYNQFPTNGDMVMDRWESWNSTSSNYRFLRNILAHEHGHGIGLLHSCPNNNTKLMEPWLSTNFDGPQHDDIRAAQYLYGDLYESDNTDASASDVGTLEIGSPIEIGEVPSPSVNYGSVLSIDADGEQDWFRVTVNESLFITVDVTPVGRWYETEDQDFDGDCCPNASNPSCDTELSQNASNLNVLVLDTDGSTPLGFGNAAGAGETETAQANFDVAGDYFIQVYEDGTPVGSQLYRITMTADVPQPCFNVVCDNDVYCDGVEFCDDGDCFDGTDPCPDPREACDEGSQSCIPGPGACCLSDGSCEQHDSNDCSTLGGSYYGDGTLCTDPLDPACEPVATLVSLVPNVTGAVPNSSVGFELYVEEVEGLQGYQLAIDIVRTSGTGDITLDCVPCPGDTCGAYVDEARTDFVFDGFPSRIVSANCVTQTVLSTLFGSATNVGATPAYLGEFTLDVSIDATPGTTFEVSIVDNPAALRDITSTPIPFRRGDPITITVLDPSDCIEPTVSGDGSRYLVVTVNGAASQALIVTGDSSNPDISCVSKYVQADGSLGDTPVFQTPAEWGGTVSVHGPEIIPSASLPGSPSTYNVQAQCGAEFSTIASGTTWVWADVWGFPAPPPPDGLVNVDDILGVIRVFQGDPTGPTIEKADVEPCLPNGQADVGDILAVISAFQGDPFPCGTPCP